MLVDFSKNLNKTFKSKSFKSIANSEDRSLGLKRLGPSGLSGQTTIQD